MELTSWKVRPKSMCQEQIASSACETGTGRISRRAQGAVHSWTRPEIDQADSTGEPSVRVGLDAGTTSGGMAKRVAFFADRNKSLSTDPCPKMKAFDDNITRQSQAHDWRLSEELADRVHRDLAGTSRRPEHAMANGRSLSSPARSSQPLEPHKSEHSKRRGILPRQETPGDCARTSAKYCRLFLGP
jgi:hypothetical protein